VSYLDDLIKHVRDYDAARPRSVQQAVGWSEVGGCRAYLGYKLDDAWASDDTDTWAAQRGTAIHEYLEAIAAGPGIRTEIDTEYRGIPGHADIVGPDWVGDFKTTSLASSRMWAEKPDVMLQKRIQAHGYAAGLVDAGEIPPDATVRIIVIPVDGTFADWWSLEEPFDRALADWGADRLEDVRVRLAAGAPLPKDKPYAWCSGWCPYFSLCRTGDDPEAAEEITDPELAGLIAAYGEAAKSWSAADKDKKRLAPLIRGLRGTTPDGWRISLGGGGEDREVLDEEWVRADYAARGEAVPLTVKPGSAPRLSVTRVREAAK
jgi:hypothetical protein